MNRYDARYAAQQRLAEANMQALLGTRRELLKLKRTIAYSVMLGATGWLLFFGALMFGG